MEIWERIREKVSEQNTTQEWVSSKIGVRPDLFRRWMSKRIMPNADQAVAIAEALGTSVEFLVTGKRPEHLSETEKRLLGTALKWKDVLEDLESLDAQVAASWVAGIHGAAAAARESNSGAATAG